MKKLNSLLVIIMAVALVLTPADLEAQRSQSADVLLGAALHQEEVEGDYEAAIETYKKLLAEYPDNRPLAAQAQFRIGICYEKLGRKEAQNAYQTVIQNYGEQKKVVAKAQERLSKYSPKMRWGRVLPAVQCFLKTASRSPITYGNQTTPMIYFLSRWIIHPHVFFTDKKASMCIL
jgi:tetratricopeptide (TPR) repeat protein